MMGLAEIRELSRRAGRDAHRNQHEPTMLTVEEIERAKRGDDSAIRRMPFLGDYLPDAWKRVPLTALGETDETHGVYLDDNHGFGAYFVDGSGFGLPNEPALTRAQFVDKLKPGYGYAVVEVGQFQVKVGAYLKRQPKGS